MAAITWPPFTYNIGYSFFAITSAIANFVESNYLYLYLSFTRKDLGGGRGSFDKVQRLQNQLQYQTSKK